LHDAGGEHADPIWLDKVNAADGMNTMHQEAGRLHEVVSSSNERLG
jgi:hypothetical protein